MMVLLNTDMVLADDLCQPVVEPPPPGTSLVDFLHDLSVRYDFSLSVPKALDDTVNIQQSMELDKLIKRLTSELNTVLLHEAVAGCATPRLSELNILSVGQDSEFLSEGLPVDTLTRIEAPEPVVIEDMERYVTEVLLKKRKANKKAMTVEQLEEFKAVKKRLRVELKDEIKQVKKDNKKNKNKANNTKTVSNDESRPVAR